MNHEALMELIDPIKTLYFRRNFEETSRDPLTKFIDDSKAQKKWKMIYLFSEFALKCLMHGSLSLGQEACKTGKDQRTKFSHYWLVDLAKEAGIFIPGESLSFLYTDEEVITHLKREVKQLVGVLDGILDIEFLPSGGEKQFSAWEVTWHYKSKNDRG